MSSPWPTAVLWVAAMAALAFGLTQRGAGPQIVSSHPVKVSRHLSTGPQRIPKGLAQAIHRVLGPGPIGLGRAPSLSGVEKTASGWRAVAPEGRLSATISTSGSLAVKLAGSSQAGSLYPRAIGWGSPAATLTPLAVNSSSLRGGRLVQEMGPLAASYQVTGGGLEQDFSIARPPSGNGHTVAVDLGPAAGWRVASGGTALVQQRPHGSAALAYGGLTTHDAGGARQPSRLQIVHGRARIAIRVSPRTHYPLTVDPIWTSTSTPVTTLTNSGGQELDSLGWSVAISGDGTTAVVGAPVVSGGGAAYVFHVTGEGSWSSSSTPTATLSKSGGGADDQLGASVAISADGTTALVGARGANVAYIFHAAGEGSWASTSTPNATLSNSGGAGPDNFGVSVAISADGTTALVGAYGVSSGEGAAYVFHAAGEGSWSSTSTPTAALTNSAGAASDLFGWSVAISADGTTALIGAQRVSSGAGAAYVFHVAGGEGSWSSTSSPTATLTNSAGAANDQMGFSVAISGDGTTALVGAWGANSNAGAAYVFHVVGEGSWSSTSTPTATLTNSGGAAGDQLGAAAAISADGTTALLGAGTAAAAYVFHVAGEGSWSNSSNPTATLSNSLAAGASVALSADGATALVGLEGANGNTGAVDMYSASTATWTSGSTPTATATNSGGAAGDEFGNSVAISADGTTAVVGATGVNSGTGAVYVFHVSSQGSWSSTSTPAATLTNAGGTTGDGFGSSVAISADGTTVVVGARSVNSGAGAAYVFHVSGQASWSSTSTPAATLTNGATGGFFGWSVSISADGTTAVVGARGVDESTGAAYVFHVAGAGSWSNSSTPAATLGSCGGAEAGNSVAISADGTTAVVGAPGASDGGDACVYHVPGAGSWSGSLTPAADLSKSPHGQADQLGWSVAISADGTTALVGAFDVSSETGAADVFHVAGEGSWASTSTPAATLTNSGGVANDQMGRSVAISADGTTALVGAQGVSSNINLGAAYVFHVAGEGSWSSSSTPTAALTNDTGASAGASVAVSADGTTAALGAPGTNGNTGALYVYSAFEPTVTSVSPSSGPTAGGTSVTITGTKLSDATEVDFGPGHPAKITTNTATQIVATAPPGSAGTVDVTATIPSGASPASSADQFTYAAPPTVGSVSPSAGPTAGETQVTITGTNLSGATEVDFGTGHPANVTTDTATQIAATSPSGSVGPVDVTVTTPGGTSATTSADQFSYVLAPTVSSVSPSAGATAGDTQVTITGTNLSGTTEVDFGTGHPANVTTDTSARIVVTSPSGSAGTADVTVTTPGGTSATSAADQFTYVAPPTVSSISPSAGPTAGGTSVTITGTNLSGATAIRFGTVLAKINKILSATSISVTSPKGSGTVDLTVTTVGGTSAKSTADHFTYVPQPTITKLAPRQGPKAGGTLVTITGINLTRATAAHFGTTAAKIDKIISASQINITAPKGSGTVDITVTTTGGTSAKSPTDHFTYVPRPTITKLAPQQGPKAGGTAATITGTNLASATAVHFGNARAKIDKVVSATQIKVTSPKGSGTVDVTVTTPGGTSAKTPADRFLY